MSRLVVYVVFIGNNYVIRGQSSFARPLQLCQQCSAAIAPNFFYEIHYIFLGRGKVFIRPDPIYLLQNLASKF